MSKTDQTTVADWAADDVQRTCENCGSHITARYERYHADENGDVHCCPACSTQPERYAGKATDPDRSVRKTMAHRTVRR